MHIVYVGSSSLQSVTLVMTCEDRDQIQTLAIHVILLSPTV